MSRLTFLGTGGAFTDFRVNYHNNLLVQPDPSGTRSSSKRYILIDCGATAVQSLKELGVHPWEIEGVIITHLHGDHIAGIEQLLWERFYTGPDGPSWCSTDLYASRGILDGLRANLTPCVNEFIDRDSLGKVGGYDVLVMEQEMGTGADGQCHRIITDTSFSLHPTSHVISVDGVVNKEAYGVEIRDEGGIGSCYYTSDTVFDETVGDRFPAGLIFHDCSFTPCYPGTVHTHYEELLTLPREVRARIVLMHHTQVPPEIDVRADGFHGAARRHEIFDI